MGCDDAMINAIAAEVQAERAIDRCRARITSLETQLRAERATLAAWAQRLADMLPNAERGAGSCD